MNEKKAKTVRIKESLYDSLAERADELDVTIGKVVELAWQSYQGEPEEIEKIDLGLECSKRQCEAKLKSITLDRAKEKLKEEIDWYCPSHATGNQSNEGETWGF